ncbi:MAG: hypothetical protein WCV87_01505 [Candidatus Paceibacterota bacterium]|jgi:hypothetical protein
MVIWFFVGVCVVFVAHKELRWVGGIAQDGWHENIFLCGLRD